MKAVSTDGDTLANAVLDVGRDDYYGHSGSWFDVQDSGLLYRLDLTLPPAPPVTATATNVGNAVQVDWAPPTPYNGLYYRVYGDDGQVIQDEAASNLTVTAYVGQTLTWTIRSEDDGGFLGPPATLRFKVGYGIVDASGAVTKDTVPPSDITKLRESRIGKALVVQWPSVRDPIGLRGYRITAPGLKPIVVKSAIVKLPRVKVHGKKISVVAIDEAGNAGVPATIVARA